MATVTSIYLLATATAVSSSLKIPVAQAALPLQNPPLASPYRIWAAPPGLALPTSTPMVILIYLSAPVAAAFYFLKILEMLAVRPSLAPRSGSICQGWVHPPVQLLSISTGMAIWIYSSATISRTSSTLRIQEAPVEPPLQDPRLASNYPAWVVQPAQPLGTSMAMAIWIYSSGNTVAASSSLKIPVVPPVRPFPNPRSVLDYPTWASIPPPYLLTLMPMAI